MKVFIDFDDVIFNTKRFRKDLEDLFLNHGISLEIFNKYYQDQDDPKAIKTFNPWRQAKQINKLHNINLEKLNKAIDNFVSDSSNYIFSDFKEFAEIIGKEKIFLVSFGDLEFQLPKVNGSRIGDMLEKIYVTDQQKSETMKEIIEKNNFAQEKIFFLDDRNEQIEDVKNNISGIITLLIKRPEGRYCDQRKTSSADYEVCNLKEAQELILKLTK